MNQDDEPRLVDLRRYRAAKQAAAKRAARKPQPQPGGDGFLGSRPKAGLILGLVVAALLALWLAPKVF